MVDLLTPRTGLGNKAGYMWKSHQILFIPKEEVASTISIIDAIAPMGERFMYNNWMYNMAVAVIEKLAGETYASYASHKLFAPLGLKRTTSFKVPDSEEDYAQSYVLLDDGTPWNIPRPTGHDEESVAGAFGMESCVSDLLVMYDTFMRAAKHQGSTSSTASTAPMNNNPFVATAEMLKPHMEITISPQPSHYSLGWVTTTLPGTLGLIGLNGRELGTKTPLCARSSAGTRVWYHNGSLPGAFSSVHILPDSSTVVVALTNTLALADVPDFIGQLLVETVLAEQNPNNWIALAMQTAERHKTRYPALLTTLLSQQKRDRPAKPLRKYTRRYYNCNSTFSIDISLSSLRVGALVMRFQGMEKVCDVLVHYEDDVFVRMVTGRDADVKEAVWPLWGERKVERRKVCFLPGADEGEVGALSWSHDSYVSYEEVFKKRAVGEAVGS